MPTSFPRTRRLLSALLLATLAGGGWAAVSLDAAELGPGTAAWEGEDHASTCPRLHDHGTCTLLQHQRWLPEIPRPPRLADVVVLERPGVEDADAAGTRDPLLLPARAPPSV